MCAIKMVTSVVALRYLVRFSTSLLFARNIIRYDDNSSLISRLSNGLDFLFGLIELIGLLCGCDGLDDMTKLWLVDNYYRKGV